MLEKRDLFVFVSDSCWLDLRLTVKQEAYYGREVIVADRDMVETQAEEILRDADKQDVSFLVVGDPYGYVIRPI